MSALYKNKHEWGVHGRKYMFCENLRSLQHNKCIAGKFYRNRKRQAHVYWKDMGKWYMREYHVFD